MFTCGYCSSLKMLDVLIATHMIHVLINIFSPSTAKNESLYAQKSPKLAYDLNTPCKACLKSRPILTIIRVFPKSSFFDTNRDISDAIEIIYSSTEGRESKKDLWHSSRESTLARRLHHRGATFMRSPNLAIENIRAPQPIIDK